MRLIDSYQFYLSVRVFTLVSFHQLVSVFNYHYGTAVKQEHKYYAVLSSVRGEPTYQILGYRYFLISTACSFLTNYVKTIRLCFALISKKHLGLKALFVRCFFPGLFPPLPPPEGEGSSPCAFFDAADAASAAGVADAPNNAAAGVADAPNNAGVGAGLAGAANNLGTIFRDMLENFIANTDQRYRPRLLTR